MCFRVPGNFRLPFIFLYLWYQKGLFVILVPKRFFLYLLYQKGPFRTKDRHTKGKLELKNSVLRTILSICVSCVHFKNMGPFLNERSWLCGSIETNFVHLSALEVEIYTKRWICAHIDLLGAQNAHAQAHH